jgi:hypothetical protein
VISCWALDSRRSAPCGQPSIAALGASPEQPQRRRIRNAVVDAQPQKPRERRPVAHLAFHLLVRKIVERLQNQHPEHHDRIKRLTASAAFARSFGRQYNCLNIAAKALPHGTSRSIASSGSPFADNADNRSSASRN